MIVELRSETWLQNDVNVEHLHILGYEFYKFGMRFTVDFNISQRKNLCWQLHIWRYFSPKGKGKLPFIDSSLNGQIKKNILCRSVHMISGFDEIVCQPNWVPCRRDKFAKNRVEYWTFSSRDLNPIEIVWELIKDTVAQWIFGI